MMLCLVCLSKCFATNLPVYPYPPRIRMFMCPPKSLWWSSSCEATYQDQRRSLSGENKSPKSSDILQARPKGRDAFAIVRVRWDAFEQFLFLNKTDPACHPKRHENCKG